MSPNIKAPPLKTLPKLGFIACYLFYGVLCVVLEKGMGWERVCWGGGEGIEGGGGGQGERGQKGPFMGCVRELFDAGLQLQPQ